jgi:oxaloacetate decarboxylase alpha subunit
LDEEPLREVSNRLYFISEKEQRPKGEMPEYDYYYYLHQVPGGMMSTLKRQLAEVGKESLIDKVLEEAIRVRQELGYPTMVTPFSQFVGTQATYNVTTGERYKVVPDGIPEYIAGWYGKPIGPLDPTVVDRIASTPQGRNVIGKEPPQISKKELRQKLGLGAQVSDEEFLLRYTMPKKEVDDMIGAGPINTRYPI